MTHKIRIAIGAAALALLILGALFACNTQRGNVNSDRMTAEQTEGIPLPDSQNKSGDPNKSASLEPETTKDPDLKAPDSESLDSESLDSKAPDSKASDSKVSSSESPNSKTPDSKTSDSKDSDSKVSDSKTSDSQASDSKSTDLKTKDSDSHGLTQSDDTGNEKKTPEYRKISAEEAYNMMNETTSFVLLDVRTDEEYRESHISGAVLIPDYEISERAETELPDKNALILVYCRSGRRSASAANQLVSLGYTDVYDFGGIIDWPYDVEKN